MDNGRLDGEGREGGEKRKVKREERAGKEREGIAKGGSHT